MTMLTIHNLEVRFEVEGEGDEVVFARLFEKQMRRWQALDDRRREHERHLALERRVVENEGDE